MFLEIINTITIWNDMFWKVDFDIGGSRGPISFIFIQFFQKSCQVIGF